MFKNEANILCLLCSKDKENIEHFILDCERLEEVRKPILQEIEEILNDKKTVGNAYYKTQTSSYYWT
jgi:uncharacterized protein (UPF0335 family)